MVRGPLIDLRKFCRTRHVIFRLTVPETGACNYLSVEDAL